jgi:hypothetical protein
MIVGSSESRTSRCWADSEPTDLCRIVLIPAAESDGDPDRSLTEADSHCELMNEALVDLGLSLQTSELTPADRVRRRDLSNTQAI